jgi:hypothetical protein
MRICKKLRYNRSTTIFATNANVILQLTTLGCLSSMDQQPEIKWHMRPCLVDFLVEVHFLFRLRPETLYLTMNIIDRYVSRRVVYIKHYQLVGCAALWIAAKFEEVKDRVPTVHDLVQACQDTYDESAFIQMEYHVLETIQWTLGHPTAEAWLRLVLCGAYIEDKETEDTSRFLMEITLFYREFVRFVPSSIAAAALTLARHICGKTRRVYEETEEILEIVDALDYRLATSVNELSETLVTKYAYAFYSKASTNTVKWYLEGGRFTRQTALLSIPVTPTRSPIMSTTTPPLSVGSTASDMSDDMPPTPSSPLATGVFASVYGSEPQMNKENHPQSFTVAKHRADPIPDQFLPHDLVAFGRPALHPYNHYSSPRVAAVS